MTTNAEIEGYAALIAAAPDSEPASIKALIGNLGEDEFYSVIDRAATISQANGIKNLRHADDLHALAHRALTRGKSACLIEAPTAIDCFDQAVQEHEAAAALGWSGIDDVEVELMLREHEGKE
jgi:hypothetical protein